MKNKTSAVPSLRTARWESPFGTLQLTATADALVGLLLPCQLGSVNMRPAGRPNTVLVETCRQLEAFFAGDRRTFELPLAPISGTDFQRRVWDELQQVPFGSTLTYTQLAQRIGRPRAVRAVGAANGRNPIPIVIPCHRVVGSTGSLTGYGGGIEMKQQLLAWEAGEPVRWR